MDQITRDSVYNIQFHLSSRTNRLSHGNLAVNNNEHFYRKCNSVNFSQSSTSNFRK